MVSRSQRIDIGYGWVREARGDQVGGHETRVLAAAVIHLPEI